eukprot:CAMPEP_0113467598 /NCGR_PEP_ID=MMETSP0014_2-20120614/14897_1 /TAXON_ID=2857 /ORGANISM="Nitzschia sp." /LENGTH=115 /DNA_ID=CAMNT_0000359911 /DNA_START=338 /DNA_END=685 /DNA_ORIENTATION=+ /assembly_acc=CAM_ASM_000159
MDKKTRESMPNIPDGILDMRGPRTLDGGYSASQYVSSALKAVFWANALSAEKETAAGDVWTNADGWTKALQAATANERTTKLSLDMLVQNISVFVLKKVETTTEESKRTTEVCES